MTPRRAHNMTKIFIFLLLTHSQSSTPIAEQPNGQTNDRMTTVFLWSN